MNLKLTCLFGAVVAAGFTIGCAPARVTYMDPGSMENKIVSIGKINQQDWGLAATKLANSMVSSGRLIRKDGKDSIVSLGRIQNKTSEHIEMALLIEKIRIGILKSGQASITTAVGAGGPEDASTMTVRRELRDNEEFEQKNVAAKGTIKAPTFSLSGRIIESGATAGRTKQSTFTFQLTLTNLVTGTAAWMDEFEIVKQGNAKASVGF